MVMFGLFLSIITLTLQGVNAPTTIAFGTSEVADLSNQYRINAGLANLTINAKLTSSAQAKANHMAENSYFAHNPTVLLHGISLILSAIAIQLQART